MVYYGERPGFDVLESERMRELRKRRFFPGDGAAILVALLLVGGIVALVVYASKKDKQGKKEAQKAGGGEAGGEAGGETGSGGAVGPFRKKAGGVAYKDGGPGAASRGMNAGAMDPVGPRSDVTVTLYAPDSTYKYLTWPRLAPRSPVFCLTKTGALTGDEGDAAAQSFDALPGKVVPVSMIPPLATSLDIPRGYVVQVVNPDGSRGMTVGTPDALDQINPDQGHFGPGFYVWTASDAAENRRIGASVCVAIEAQARA